MAGDWFRTPDWTPGAQEHFEARLQRSRAWNRAQYIRLKGLALEQAGLREPARELWKRILREDLGLEFEKATTLEHLGDSYRDADPRLSAHYYHRLLSEHPSLNGTSSTVEISLAELEMARGRRAHPARASSLLDAFWERGGSPFPAVLFRCHLARIDVARATGDRETVKRAATTALELASLGPVFTRHGDVGVVEADAGTLRRLRRLSR